MPRELDHRTEDDWHARGGHASDDADHDEALERQDREREKQGEPPERDVTLLAFAAEPRAWGRCQACYRYAYRRRTPRGLVCYRCR